MMKFTTFSVILFALVFLTSCGEYNLIEEQVMQTPETYVLHADEYVFDSAKQALDSDNYRKVISIFTAYNNDDTSVDVYENNYIFFFHTLESLESFSSVAYSNAAVKSYESHNAPIAEADSRGKWGIKFLPANF